MYQADWLDIILYLGCIQGFFLTALLWKKRPSNQKAVLYLSWLVGLVSLLILARVGFQLSWIQHVAEVLMVPDAILFLSGPLLWFFTRSLLRLPLPEGKKYGLHYLPAVLHVCVLNTAVGLTLGGYYPVLSREALLFLIKLIEGAAIFSLSLYLYWSWRDYRNYHIKFYEKYAVPVSGNFLYKFILSIFLMVLVWAGAFIRNQMAALPDYAIYSIIWILITFAIYYLAYMVLSRPAILELPAIPKPLEIPEPQLPELNGAQKTALEKHMETAKPFLDPLIKLDDLAAQMTWQRHELSAVINRGFGKNFFDFINSYRVREFIAQKQKAARPLGTLELAYAVGFNSKSAFNRAFKKETGESPKNYFGSLHGLFSD